MNSNQRAFSLSVDPGEDKTVVRVAGEIDLATAPLLESRLLELCHEGVRQISVDMADTDFIDSTGLHALIVAVKSLRAQGGDLFVQSPSRKAARLLELSGIDSVIRII